MADEKDRESGQPGGGAGRKDDVKGSPIYPMSGPHPPDDAKIVGQASFGQGERGAAGYEDSGRSELDLGGATQDERNAITTQQPAKEEGSDERNTAGVVPPRQDRTRDPEFEMPDPEQVKRDIAEDEKVYRPEKEEKKKKAS